MAAKRKPTRRDLLVVISRLQTLVGSIGSAANDRNSNSAAQLAAIERRGMQICLEATSQDPAVTNTGPYKDDGHDSDWKYVH
jgi:hypothetical protein